MTIIKPINDGGIKKKYGPRCNSCYNKTTNCRTNNTSNVTARALRVRAAGISDFVTNPLRIGMIGVLSESPAPNAKVKINNMVGVTNFNIVIIPNTADIADI